VDKVESEYVVNTGPGLADSGRIDILAEGRWDELGNEAFWRLGSRPRSMPKNPTTNSHYTMSGLGSVPSQRRSFGSS